MINKTYLQFTEKLQERNSTKYIILHHAKDSGSYTVEDVHRVHQQRGMAGIAYHYFIDRNGEIFEGRPEFTVGAHAKGYNDISYGICFEGDFNKETMGERQMDAGAMLIALLEVYYVYCLAESLELKQWCDLNKETDDPGRKFPFEQLKYKVEDCKKYLLAFFGKKWGKNEDDFDVPVDEYFILSRILYGEIDIDHDDFA